MNPIPIVPGPRRTPANAGFPSTIGPATATEDAARNSRRVNGVTMATSGLPQHTSGYSAPVPDPFLTARWTNLCIFTWPVPPRQLEPLLPPGLELDTIDGDAFVSLVAFDFLDTRVFGVRWPGLTTFPEINLRFYVREPAAEGRPARRGVMFIREYVRSRVICLTARLFYNEPYRRADMASRVEDVYGRNDDGSPRSLLRVEHEIRVGSSRSRLGITGSVPALVPSEDTLEHFFKEHQWGYGRDPRGELLRYEVQHPVWAAHPVVDSSVDIDWPALYGPEWGSLRGVAPLSVMLAAGSEVLVFPASRRAEVASSA